MAIRWLAVLALLWSAAVFSAASVGSARAQDAEDPGDEPAAEESAEEDADEPAAEEPSEEEPAEEEPATEEEPAAEEEPAEEEPAEEEPAEEEPAEPAPSDEPAPAEEPAPAADPVAAEQAKEQFAAMFTDWKAMLMRLRELQAEYKATEPSGRDAIITEFNELVAKGDEMAPQLTTAAEAVFKAVGPEDPQITAFLASAVIMAAAADDYETTLRIGKTLIDAGVAEPKLLQLVGSAAFSSDDFDTAEAYFNQAAEQDALDPAAMNDNSFIAEYRELLAAEQQIRAEEAAADDLPRVSLNTSKGEIIIELFENEAPNTVANFVKLVEDGFYDGITFHRVLPGFMAQGGCPNGDGSGGPGHNIKDECDEEYPNHRKHFRGSLSMAKTPLPDTGGSQFFLTFRPTPSLNGKHTVFGRVVEGLDVLPKLQRRNPQDPNAPPPDRIVEATVIRKRDHEYAPETLPES